MKKKDLSVLIVVFGLLLAKICFAGVDDGMNFPLREKYPSVTPVGTEELTKLAAVIIDCRSKVEFDIVHIDGAVHIPVGKMTKVDLDKYAGKSLIFYCNGITCAKSYKAVEKATGLGFKDAKVYDAGIFHWAKIFPEKTLFFGEKLTAATVKTTLLSEFDLDKESLLPAEFITTAKTGNYIIIDVRDPNERSEIPIRLANMRQMPFDVIADMIKTKNPSLTEKPLLILDNVGKQVEWLQYLLVRAGFKEYKFLRGGVAQWKKDGFDLEGNK